MENQNEIEQCIVALTQIIMRDNQPQNWRSRIEKEIQFLPTFEGGAKTLPSFIESVTRALADYENEADAVYQIIYNQKIQGSAKNLLSVNPPVNWTECMQRLKKHYRPSKNQMTITRDIGSLRVSSIKDLDNKIRQIVEDITEYAAFDNNGETMVDIFSGMLVQRVKELVSGSFSIMTKSRLTEIREIVNSFIGQDQSNLNMNLIIRNFSKQSENRGSEKRINTQRNQNLYGNRRPNNNYQNRTVQYRNNNWQPKFNYNNYQQSNGTQQFRQNDHGRNESRQNRQRPQPMEVDAISRAEANVIDDTFFKN